MPKSKLDWFPLYVDDILNSKSIASISNAAGMIYIKLLCLAWKEDGISDNFVIAGRLISATSDREMKKEWPSIKQLWVPHPTKPNTLVNPRQEEIRAEAQRRSAAAYESGKLGGRPRKTKPNQNQMVTETIPNDKAALSEKNHKDIDIDTPSLRSVGAREPEKNQTVSATAEFNAWFYRRAIETGALEQHRSLYADRDARSSDEILAGNGLVEAYELPRLTAAAEALFTRKLDPRARWTSRVTVDSLARNWALFDPESESRSHVATNGTASEMRLLDARKGFEDV